MTSKNSYRTAIKRTRLSAPMAALNKKDKIVGRCMDYGCGRGFDADALSMERYDPHFSPKLPTGLFDTITCNFVLNVIEDEEERIQVLQDIQSRLVSGGNAYITVRTDKKSLNGCTKIGTWQGHIELDLPVVQKGSGYCTYQMYGCDTIESAKEVTE